MPSREVLKGSWWPGAGMLVMGVLWGLSALLSDDRRLMDGLLCAGAQLVGVRGLWFRDTVLDEAGLRAAGTARTVRWSEVTAVTQSRMALHYRDLEITVEGRRRPLRIEERRDGRDHAAVAAWWLRAHGGTREQVLPAGGPDDPSEL